MKTHLEKLKLLTEEQRQLVIKEAPHTKILNVPEELEFLEGSFVDLGFENLGLEQPELAEIYFAFMGHGVRIPGTPYRLRNDRAGITYVEYAEGYEKELPRNWAEAVLVLDDNGQPKYVGSRVRKDQLP